MDESPERLWRTAAGVARWGRRRSPKPVEAERSSKDGMLSRYA
ncbi:hypothetical protein HMPREF0185_00212 [Brevundimonas diminuta 470-4]|nr:hypothetical protein HMPREF0185_00212 [Brevundimonas diminuta 470-4]